MFTLIYQNGEFDRPDTLLAFLRGNVWASHLDGVLESVER